MIKRLTGILSGKANKTVALFLVMTFVVSTCCGFAYATPNDITIADSDGAPVQIKTMDTNVGKILSKQGIILNEGDRVNYALTDNVGDEAIISIKRAMSVNIAYMGDTTQFLTTEREVSKVLAEYGVYTDKNDDVYPAVHERVSEGATITVIARDSHNVTVQEEVEHAVTEIENPELAAGERIVIQEGRNGVNEYTYEIHYEDGVEISRTLVKDEVLSTPVEEIVERGPENIWELGVVPASRPTNYSRVEVFTATAYDASPADNGPWAGKTSTGMPLVYGVIAVDPRVIPYGTKMYIESVDGQYIYGYAIAGDCGGAIKGNKVDLFFPSRSTCYSFGRRQVRIYFMD